MAVGWVLIIMLAGARGSPLRSPVADAEWAGRPQCHDKLLRGQALVALVDRLDRLGEFLVVNRNGKQLAAYALISRENRLPTEALRLRPIVSRRLLAHICLTMGINYQPMAHGSLGITICGIKTSLRHKGLARSPTFDANLTV